MSHPEPAHAVGAEDRSSSPGGLGELLSGVTQDISTLFRQEVELARAEITESAKKAGKGAGLFGGAGAAGYFALLFLSAAAAVGLGYVIGFGWSTLIVGVVYLVVALVLFLLGRAEFKTIRGAPRTVDSVKKIPDALKPGGHA